MRTAAATASSLNQHGIFLTFIVPGSHVPAFEFVYLQFFQVFFEIVHCLPPP
ncbi:hypothetical protein T458_07480 [Brevibacillus panacihumi W25]|uniref:Uncharacterized protein n=1 Tax=Brevibacillus panacihumi W25 TaxID=1408254 RepID=V6MBV5_9BACL|nr:hypothetical protein T458_07480 [Brevibacillus panacihumi W25]